MGVETDADWLLATAEYGAHDAPYTVELAERLLGPRGVVAVSSREAGGNGAELERDGAGWRIIVSASAPESAHAFLIGHELAHWFYRSGPGPFLRPHILEWRCNALARALVLLRVAFMDSWAARRGALVEVAADFPEATIVDVARRARRLHLLPGLTRPALRPAPIVARPPLRRVQIATEMPRALSWRSA